MFLSRVRGRCELGLLQGFEMFSVAVFTIEYLTRLALTRPHRRYVLSFFGLIDIISIVPFYLSLGVGTESMRALRLLRFACSSSCGTTRQCCASTVR